MNEKFLKWKLIILCCFVFLFGYLMGNLFDLTTISNLEGYGYIVESNALEDVEECEATTCNATTCNATTCNATTCNATTCNATTCNATTCNATSCNATSCNATTCNATTCNATTCNATTCNATTCNATSCNATTCNATSCNTTTNTDNNNSNTITAEEVIYNEITSFEVLTKEIYLGEKVFLKSTYKNSDIKSVSVTFMNKSDNTLFTRQVQSLGNNEYILFSNDVKAGIYELIQINLFTSNTEKTYSSGVDGYDEIINGKNISIDVMEKAEDSILTLKNENITSEQITQIRGSNKKLDVILNCDNNSIITSSVFDAIKESNSKLILVYGENKMTFLGEDIKTLKDIDFKVNVSEVEELSNLKDLVNNGLVVEFPNNKELPGNALVSINIDEKYKSYFTNEITVYYHNEITNELELIANNINLQNNTIEFNINHNSNYILTNSIVNKENIDLVNEEEEVVSFLNNKLIYIAVIGCSIILIIIVTVIVLLQRKKRFGKMI